MPPANRLAPGTGSAVQSIVIGSGRRLAKPSGLPRPPYWKSTSGNGLFTPQCSYAQRKMSFPSRRRPAGIHDGLHIIARVRRAGYPAAFPFPAGRHIARFPAEWATHIRPAFVPLLICGGAGKLHQMPIAPGHDVSVADKVPVLSIFRPQQGSQRFRNRGFLCDNQFHNITSSIFCNKKTRGHYAFAFINMHGFFSLF